MLLTILLKAKEQMKGQDKSQEIAKLKSEIEERKKEYPDERVFFLKICYGRALQDTKKLQNLHG